MGSRASLGQFVRFLVEHDFVHESAGFGVGGGHPGHAGAGEPLLHRLQEALEIPDGEDVAFHKPPQPLGRIDEAVDPVADEPLPGVTEVDGMGQAGRPGRGKRGGRHGDEAVAKRAGKEVDSGIFRRRRYRGQWRSGAPPSPARRPAARRAASSSAKPDFRAPVATTWSDPTAHHKNATSLAIGNRLRRAGFLYRPAI